MKFEIKSRSCGEVIFELDCASSKTCVEAAIKSDACLSCADLYDACLSDANLSRAKDSALILARQRICPAEGAFVGFKELASGKTAKLVIPHAADRMNALGSRKCRASKVFVHELEVESYDKHTGKLLYKQGCEVVPDKFDPDIRAECSHGIHFFLTMEEAEAY